MATCEVEVFVLVDEDGNAVASCDAGTLDELYDSNVGNGSAYARRVIKLTLQVPTPAVLELSGTVPEEGGEIKLSVA